MNVLEAQAIVSNTKQSEHTVYLAKRKELIERYTLIAEEFIKDASARGSSNTGLCHTYEDPFDRKVNGLYGEALEVVAMRLRDKGFSARYYDNRSISTMGITIDWRVP